jgi:hypothetical protein
MQKLTCMDRREIKRKKRKVRVETLMGERKI